SGRQITISYGNVTTSAPSYSPGTSNALSLTTVGNLRVDGSSVTQPVSGSVTAYADGYATTSAPTYTNNTYNPLSLTTGGLLRTFTQITDASGDGPANVKPASTAAVASDPALVVT